jgi:hypothetical protein
MKSKTDNSQKYAGFEHNIMYHISSLIFSAEKIVEGL